MAGELSFDAWINNSDFKRQIDDMNNRIMGLSKTAQAESEKMQDAFSSLSGIMAGVFSVAAIEQITSKLITVRGEFQQLDIGLRTMLGSKEKADKLMAQVVDLAAKTPFTLQEVGTGAKQLLSYQFGADEIINTLQRLGDVASGLGVPIGRLILVYGQVKAKGRLMGDDMRQFSEAGIPMAAALADEFNKVNNTTTMTTAGIQKLVSEGKIGFEQVKAVMENMTNEGGMFYNLMEQNSKSLTGLTSNLEDAMARMWNDLGKSMEGVLGDGIELAIDLVNNYEPFLKILGSLVASYGAYKAVLILVNAQRKIETTLGVFDIATKQLQVGATLKAAWAQSALNKAMLANPYAFVAAAVIALGVALVSFWPKAKTTEELINNTTSAIDEFNKAGANTDKLTQEYERLNAKVVKTNTEHERLNAVIKQLAATVPAAALAWDKYGQVVGINIEKVKQFTKESKKAASIKLTSALVEDWKRLKEEQARFDELNSKVKSKTKQVYVPGSGFTGGSYVEAKMSAAEWAEVVAERDKQGKTILELRNKISAARTTLGLEKTPTVTPSGTKVSEETNKQALVRLNKQLIEQEKILKQLRSGDTVFNAEKIKKQEEAISATRKEITAVTGIKEKKTTPEKKKTVQDLFDEELKAKKKAYEDYEAWAVELGQASADKTFSALIAKNKDFESYLISQRTAILNNAKGGKLSKDDEEKVKKINGSLQAFKEDNALTKFNEALAKIQTSTDSVYEKLKKVQDLKLAATDTSTPLGSSLSNKDRQTATKASYEEEVKLQESIIKDLESNYKTHNEKIKEIKTQGDDAILFLENLKNNATLESDKQLIQERINLIKKGQSEMMSELSVSKFETDNKSMLDLVFGDTSNYPTDTILDFISNIKDKLASLPDSDKSSNAVKSLMLNLDALEKTAKSNEKNPFKQLKDALADYSKEAKKAEKATTDVEKAAAKAGKQKGIKDAAAAAGTILQGAGQIFDSVTSSLDQLGLAGDEESKKLMKNISGMVSGATDVAMGIASGNPIQIITGSITLITNAIQAFDSKNREINRSITKHQEALSELQTSYNQLSRAVDNALGDNYLLASKKALDSLKAQRAELIKIKQLESSKEGKNKDQEAIDKTNEQLTQISNDIEDALQKLKDDLLTTDVKGFAKQLGDSLFDAASKGISGMEAYGKISKQIIGDIIKKMLQTKLLEKQLEPIMNNLFAAVYDEKTAQYKNMTAQDLNSFTSGVASVAENYTKVFDQINASLGGVLTEAKDVNDKKDALTGQVKGVTEETASMLAGNIVAIRMNSAENLQTLKQVVSVLLEIAGHTKYNIHLLEIRDLLKAQSTNDLRAQGL